MKRIAQAALTVLLLWTLAPAGSEILENALHFALEGHAAHEAADGDRHDPTGPEHGCTDVVHLCSCCMGLSVLPARGVAVLPAHRSSEPLTLASDSVPVFTGGGIYRPPRV